ncbi:uncharacterized protein LOC127095368 [Lathyrus oleraceus]|uniref:uncharacterized protein LOC127095368 n=1 Tax=Pisum sativum TaxID=3888 RepID=UPI0021D08B6E|nr:uncharacterized protein LOC127095368 [Pisum sativum]
MLKDFIEFAKGYQECQIHSGMQHVPVSELHAVVKPWTFRGWALNLIGEIRLASSKSKKYILVGIDYFTNWIKAIPLVKADQDSIIEFVQKPIIDKFGIPETITTDQSSVFTGRKMKEFSSQTRIKLLTLTPYYAQENGCFDILSFCEPSSATDSAVDSDLWRILTTCCNMLTWLKAGYPVGFRVLALPCLMHVSMACGFCYVL